MTADELKAKLAQEEKALDEFLKSANVQAATKQGRIAMLRELLATMEQKAEG